MQQSMMQQSGAAAPNIPMPGMAPMPGIPGIAPLPQGVLAGLGPNVNQLLGQLQALPPSASAPAGAPSVANLQGANLATLLSMSGAVAPGGLPSHLAAQMVGGIPPPVAHAEEKDKPKKKKRKKDPNAPKPAKSAYHFFQFEKRPELMKAHPDMKPQDVSKRLGELWRSISDSDKARCTAEAEADKVRYDAEKAVYVPPPGCEEDDDDDEEEEDEAGAKPKAKAAKAEKKSAASEKKDKDENAPKRPMSAYFLFVQAKRPEVTAEEKASGNEALGVTDMSKKCAELWREMTAEDKAPWDELSAQAKRDYEATCATYAKSGEALVGVSLSKDFGQDVGGASRVRSGSVLEYKPAAAASAAAEAADDGGRYVIEYDDGGEPRLEELTALELKRCISKRQLEDAADARKAKPEKKERSAKEPKEKKPKKAKSPAEPKAKKVKGGGKSKDKLVGLRFIKSFSDVAYKGKVLGLRRQASGEKLYHVGYDDNDEEEMPLSELKPLVEIYRKFCSIRDAPLEPKDDDQLVGVIRLSRRLIGGASVANLKTMSETLDITVKGNKKQTSTRLEHVLDALGFSTHPFAPTPEDVALDLDEFNDKFEDTIYEIEEICTEIQTIFSEGLAPGGKIAELLGPDDEIDEGEEEHDADGAAEDGAAEDGATADAMDQSA